MRIFDNPRHPAYGPVRRVWIMLAGLDLLDGRFDRGYENHYGVAWDECMAGGIASGVLSEAQLARLIVGRMIRMA